MKIIRIRRNIDAKFYIKIEKKNQSPLHLMMTQHYEALWDFRVY